jgi:hypothetical protein
MSVFNITSADDEITGGLPDGAWGRELRLDMSGCDYDFLADPAAVAEWARNLVDEIGMKPYGDPQIATFGKGVLFGHTVIQLIETSNLAAFVPAVGVHANHRSPIRSAFVNAFSCCDFSVPAAVDFTVRAFAAKKYTVRNDLRIPPPLDD